MTTRIGIDPGVSGAIALYGESIVLTDMPTVVKTSGKGRQVDGVSLGNLMSTYLSLGLDLHAYLELVGPMPGQGVTSMFSMGKSCGIAEGVVSALRIPFTMVSPQRWKRRAGLIGGDKEASRSRAIQLFPDAAPHLTRKRDHARAEALLIAHFGGE